MNRLETIIATAVSEGILPPGAGVPAASERPWPVVLLTALGAWLAAVPLLVALYLLLDKVFYERPTCYLIGAIMLAASTALLRVKVLPLFVEQVAVPGLLTGGLALGYALFRDLPSDVAGFVAAAIALGVAWLIPRPWLRTVLGAAACILATNPNWPRLLPEATLPSLLGTGAVWLLLQAVPLAPHSSAARTSMADGWVLATLAGLAFWSGMTFLAGASIAPFGGGARDPDLAPYGVGLQVISLLLAGGAAAWTLSHWPSLQTGWSALGAAVVTGLAWMMPSLGAVLLILAACATQFRWRLGITAGVAAAWIIGAFYYQLAYPLATKAAIMVTAAALLGALAWSALRRRAIVPAATPVRGDSPHAPLGIAACALAVLAVVNVGIWQKQAVIAEGQPVFVELGPVDPRSLMQGDYMRLAFRLPRFSERNSILPGERRPLAIGRIDARRVLTLERIADGGALAPGEIAIELTPVPNGWTLVTDAWQFKEGDASRWTRARYGEFRVAPDGRALLVGMRGAELEPLLTP